MHIHKTIYCRRWNLSSPLIRLGDGMRAWSHEAGILADGEHVVEATFWKGVVVTPLSEVINRSSEYEIVARRVEDKASGDEWALSTVGALYDYLGALGKPLNRDWEVQGRWFCSEHNRAWMFAMNLSLYRPGTRGVGPNDNYANLMGVIDHAVAN